MEMKFDEFAFIFSVMNFISPFKKRFKKSDLPVTMQTTPEFNERKFWDYYRNKYFYGHES